MRTCLFLTGELRGFHHCVESWDWLLSQMDEVRFHCEPPRPGETPIESLIPRAQGVYVAGDPKWGEHVIGTGMPSAGDRAFNQQSVAVCAGIMTKRRQLGFPLIPEDCERVVYCRPDNFFHSQLQLDSLDAGRLWVTSRFSFGGYCDRFVIASRTDMRVFVDFHDHLNDWTGGPRTAQTPGWAGNCETRLFHYLRRRVAVQRIPTSFLYHNVQADGERRYVLPEHQGLFTLEEVPTLQDVLASGPLAHDPGAEISFAD